MAYMEMTSRECVRCGLALTDAASQEAGVGPICRKLDNKLLAKLIPSNVFRAREVLASLNLASGAEATLPKLAALVAALAEEKAETREDWREVVKGVEWALSHSANEGLRKGLTDVVSALGYVGLASLWKGEAATGLAMLTCTGDKLVLQGPNNAAARRTLKRIAGSRFHYPGKLLTKAAWTFPVSQYAAFEQAVITHYPNHEGLAEALAGAKNILANMPKEAPAVSTVAAVPGPHLPKAACTIEKAGDMLRVRTPYKPEFITELKADLKWTDRRWNKEEKLWEVAATNTSTVVGLLVKHFGPDALSGHGAAATH